MPRWPSPCRWCGHLANASESNQCASVASPSEHWWEYGRAWRWNGFAAVSATSVYGHADLWVRLPACGFLLVFSSNHSPKMQRLELWAWDRQRDGSQRCVMPSCGRSHNDRCALTLFSLHQKPEFSVEFGRLSFSFGSCSPQGLIYRPTALFHRHRLCTL